MSAEPAALTAYVVGVRPGNGVVARYPGVVLVLPEIGDRSAPTAARMLRLCADSRQGQSGARLARRIVALLGEEEPQDVPALGLLVDGPVGLVAILSGPVDLAVLGPSPLTRTGAGAVTWVEVPVPADHRSLCLAASGSGQPEPLLARYLDLEQGITPGAGVDLRRAPDRELPDPLVEPANGADQPAAATRATEDLLAPDRTAGADEDDEDADADEDDEDADADADDGDAVLVGLLAGPDDDFVAGQPLPVAGAAPARAAPGADDVVVSGILCSRGHFSDPAAAYCSACGISMVQRTHEHVSGPRPPLGVIVFDDGTTFTLIRDYVLGRDPGLDDAVAGGRAWPLVVEDPDHSVSRVHAELHLEGWDVFVADRGSSNGTYVSEDGSTWRLLPASVPQLLPPGTRVRMGARVFVFDTYRKT